jgi:hypothetical protein
MTRDILPSLGEGQVIGHCLKAKVGVSAIEGLVGGGVRLVCRSTAGGDNSRDAQETCDAGRGGTGAAPTSAPLW